MRYAETSGVVFNKMYFNFFTELIIVLLILLWVLHFYCARNFNYFKQRNVAYVPPKPFFGNFFKVLTFQKTIAEVIRDVYNSTTEPFVGFFIGDEPCLLARDPELVKAVLVKDFPTFVNRCIANNYTEDPMGSNLLFIMKTPDWTEMRRRITPVFTSGKMRIIYKLIRKCGEEMAEHVKQQILVNPVLDVRDLAAKYTTEAITSGAFGVDANCFKNKDSEFRKVSKKVFNWFLWERVICTTCYFLTPKIVKWLGLKFLDNASSNFLRKAFWDIMFEREKNNFTRHDLLDILIQMKNERKIENPYNSEGDKLVAQASQFFIAGSETTGTTMTFTIYELALNKSIQDKLRKEIKDTMKKYDEITYDVLRSMEYLDACVKEALRKYPSIGFLDRRCGADYQIPGTDVFLDKGTPVYISLIGLQNDPIYFPDPEKYNPTRFLKDNSRSVVPFSYLPLGDGPRSCIGARFGVMAAKSGVIHIISQFEVELCDESQYPVQFDSKGILLAPTKGVFLKFNKIQS